MLMLRNSASKDYNPLQGRASVPHCEAAVPSGQIIARSFVLQFVKFVSADQLAVIILYLSVIP